MFCSKLASLIVLCLHYPICRREARRLYTDIVATLEDIFAFFCISPGKVDGFGRNLAEGWGPEKSDSVGWESVTLKMF